MPKAVVKHVLQTAIRPNYAEYQNMLHLDKQAIF